jgi:hypothetical protein
MSHPEQGKSAFQIAQQLGFEGTKEEWLAALVKSAEEDRIRKAQQNDLAGWLFMKAGQYRSLALRT